MSLYRTKLLKGILSAKPKGPDLYFEMRAFYEFRVTPKFTAPGVVLKYSINAGQTWHEISSGETTPYTPRSIRFIGVSPSGSLFASSNSSNAWGVQFSDPNVSPTKWNAELGLAGNMMALVMDTFEDTTLKTAVGAHAFAYMFFNMELLQYIETETLLPATTLANNCYASMFEGCTRLTSAPNLPATTLANNCYSNMFYSCVNLTIAPDLPATTLATECYYSMFEGCTRLTSAPDLPATTLATRCYQNMFYGCANLTIAPDLPATTLATECYRYMFYGCSRLTSAPDLPATTLATRCYRYMFYGCKGLTSITLHYTGVDTSYFTSWIKFITTTGTLYKAGTQFSAPSNDTYPTTWTQVQIGLVNATSLLGTS